MFGGSPAIRTFARANLTAPISAESAKRYLLIGDGNATEVICIQRGERGECIRNAVQRGD